MRNQYDVQSEKFFQKTVGITYVIRTGIIVLSLSVLSGAVAQENELTSPLQVYQQAIEQEQNEVFSEIQAKQTQAASLKAAQMQAQVLKSTESNPNSSANNAWEYKDNPLAKSVPPAEVKPAPGTAALGTSETAAVASQEKIIDTVPAEKSDNNLTESLTHAGASTKSSPSSADANEGGAAVPNIYLPAAPSNSANIYR